MALTLEYLFLHSGLLGLWINEQFRRCFERAVVPNVLQRHEVSELGELGHCVRPLLMLARLLICLPKHPGILEDIL